MMRARRLNRTILFEVPFRRDNGAGGSTVAWADPTPIAAEMIPLRSATALAHQIEKSQQTWKVTIRWRPDITADCRLVIGGTPFKIIGPPVDPDGRERWLVMTCQSGVNI